jgi:hypothetical protein
MPKKIIKVQITLTEEMLGTASSNAEIHREFIASKAPDAETREEEVAALGSEAVADKAMTVFPREAGQPFIFDYQMKGFLKDACGSLARVEGTMSNKLKAYKKVIDGTVFVQPRKLMLELHGGVIGNCQRPLRAVTAQGERIALANSETAPVGTTLTMDFVLLDDRTEKILREWLDYGALRGIGQWRNSGKGRFDWKELKAKAK